MAKGNFRFVNKEKTLAVAGLGAARDTRFLLAAKKANFHVITGFTDIVEKLKMTGFFSHTYLDLSTQRKVINGNSREITELNNLIDSHLRAGHKVLLHCFAGITLSPTVAGTYLLSQGYGVDEATSAVAHRTSSQIEREIIRQYLTRNKQLLEEFQ